VVDQVVARSVARPSLETASHRNGSPLCWEPNGPSLVHKSPVELGGITEQEETIMSVARVSEISATSTQSFEDAIRQGLERASRTLRGITSAWIKEQRVKLENGKIVAFQVNMQVTFVLDE
jgi:dodecin